MIYSAAINSFARQISGEYTSDFFFVEKSPYGHYNEKEEKSRRCGEKSKGIDGCYVHEFDTGKCEVNDGECRCGIAINERAVGKRTPGREPP